MYFACHAPPDRPISLTYLPIAGFFPFDQATDADWRYKRLCAHHPIPYPQPPRERRSATPSVGVRLWTGHGLVWTDIFTHSLIRGTLSARTTDPPTPIPRPPHAPLAGVSRSSSALRRPRASYSPSTAYRHTSRPRRSTLSICYCASTLRVARACATRDTVGGSTHSPTATPRMGLQARPSRCQ